jgi:hypothetical protein
VKFIKTRDMSSLTRREFLGRTAAVTSAALALGVPARGANFKGKLRKAMIVGEVTNSVLEPLKEAGFQGVETTHICSEEEAAKGRDAADKLGMRVHSVLRGWMEFNSEEPAKVEEGLEKSRMALRAAKG